MKQLISLIIIAFLCHTLSAQNFRTHKVKDGETIESIAKQYFVTPHDIYALNPDTKTNLDINTILIIPKSLSSTKIPELETKEIKSFITHKVRRKETLYSLSKKYDVEIEDIKKHNPRLYSENLRKKDKIKIPKFNTVVLQNPIKNSLKTYRVKPKEGKFGIARKFGITILELEALNPNMNEPLQIGDQLIVPNIPKNEELPVDANYDYYEVLPAEGFFRLKIKLGLTKEELEELNPELRDQGLKNGMVLKIPLNTVINHAPFPEDSSNKPKLQLINFKPKQLAVLLPFKLKEIDSSNVHKIKETINQKTWLGIALDFHSGVLMALDSAKRMGISTNLKVFDSRGSISKLLNTYNNFANYDAVIGPLIVSNIDKVAMSLKTYKIPVIAPLTKPNRFYDNLFQTLPSENILKQAIINFAKSELPNTNVLIVSDQRNIKISSELKVEFIHAQQLFSELDKDGEDLNSIKGDTLKEALVEGNNLVFLETDDEGFASNVISLLNGLKSEKIDIILITTNKRDVFDSYHVSNDHLSNLQFHYPSVNKSFNAERPNGFIKQYKNEYNIEPNKYAIRGFDVTLDVLIRLASSTDFYQDFNNAIETEYIENKFKYNKHPLNGYYNESYYILKHSDLKIEDVTPIIQNLTKLEE